MRHTAGPWRPYLSKHEIQVLSDFGTVAIAFDCEVACDGEANAQLIAQAPDLLELCKRVARLNPDAGEIGAGMLKQLVDEARRIETKATE